MARRPSVTKPVQPVVAPEVGPAPVPVDVVTEGPTPTALVKGSSVRIRIGGPDDAPVYVTGEVTKADPVCVLLAGVDGRSLALPGHPTPLGYLLPSVTEGPNVGQFTRL